MTSATAVRPSRDLDVLSRDLASALLQPRDPGGMARLLADLCTPAEIRTMAERWHVARLLDSSDLTYREIHEATGVSTTTIVRVARFLKQERHQGYRAALDALDAVPGEPSDAR
jgi:TrpR-related protein YerC/YecD